MTQLRTHRKFEEGDTNAVNKHIRQQLSQAAGASGAYCVALDAARPGTGCIAYGAGGPESSIYREWFNITPKGELVWWSSSRGLGLLMRPPSPPPRAHFNMDAQLKYGEYHPTEKLYIDTFTYPLVSNHSNKLVCQHPSPLHTCIQPPQQTCCSTNPTGYYFRGRTYPEVERVLDAFKRDPNYKKKQRADQQGGMMAAQQRAMMGGPPGACVCGGCADKRGGERQQGDT